MRPIHSNLTAEYVRSILDYDPNTGDMKWKHRADKSTALNARTEGKIARCRRGGGQYYVTINRIFYPLAHLAWLWMTGSAPNEEIDHINRINTDNRWLNLREASRRQNCMNRRKRADSLSPYKGVSRSGNKWKASIQANGKPYYLGCFDDPESAAIAYRHAAIELHGPFASHLSDPC